jgi:Carboxypeptidase regulatory-like domain/TonB dependent receptor
MTRQFLRSAAVLLLLVGALPAGAQSLLGGLKGTVKDDQGGALPGATVTVTGKTGSKTAVTDQGGNYRFPALDPGSYEIGAELTGFKPKKQEVTIAIGSQLTIDFAMAVGTMSESIEVVGEAPVVDTTSSATNNSLSQDVLFNIPMDRHSFNVYNYAPGINDYSAYGGGQDTANALLLDGVDTRDPEGGTDWSFFNFNIIEEVQVGGLGAPAEYGSFTGALINTVTKSGGNQFSGLFDVNYSKASLSSENSTPAVIAVNPTLASGDKVTKFLDITGQLSGPLIKDKLFFFVSAQRFNQEEDPVGPRTLRTDLSNRFNGKLTFSPGPNDTVTAAVQFDDYSVSGRAGQPGTYLSTDNQTVKEDAPEWIWNLQWRHLFSSNTFIEAKYLGWWGYYYLDPVNQQPSHFDGATGLYSGGAGWHYYADRGRQEGHVAISHYADGWGKHELKFGAEIERSHARDRYGYVPGGYYYDYGGKPYYAYEYSYDIKGSNHRDAFYAQDSWKVSDRLTINPGLRFDWVRGISPDLSQTVYDTKSWGPRIGFAFDVTGDHKTVLRGYYGRLFEGALFTFYQRAVPGVGDYVTLDPVTREELGRSVTPVYKVDPNVKQPHVDDYNVAFERALGKDFRLQVTGIYRQNKDFVTSVIPSALWTPKTLDTTFKTGTTPAFDWANYDQSSNDFLITNPNGFVYRDQNGNPIGTAQAYRNYKALQVVLSKRLSSRWYTQTSYVLSKAYGTVDSAGSASYGQGRQFETPTLALINADGESIPSVRDEFKLFAGYTVPKIEVAMNAYYRHLSGETYTAYQRYGSSSIYFPPSYRGRQPLLEPRGSERMDPLNLVDLRLEKIFKLAGNGRKDRLGLYVDIKNVFNVGTVDVVNTRVPGTSLSTLAPDGSVQTTTVPLGGPLGIVAPRQVTLAARWFF